MKMKRILGSFLVLSLLLVGCASNTSSTPKQSDEVTIYIVRHGKTMLNTTDRSQGWIDAPLTPAGIEVAEYLGRGFKSENIKFDAVYTSTSGRTIETAEIVLGQMAQLDLMKDATKMTNFREFNFGTFEGMMNHDMLEAVAIAQGRSIEAWQVRSNEIGFAKSIAEFADTLSQLDREKVAEGINWPAEDYETIVNRSLEGLDILVKESIDKGNQNILLVSHGMTIATMLVNLDENTQIPATGLKNASVAKVTYKDGKYTVETVNDMSFIEKGK